MWAGDGNSTGPWITGEVSETRIWMAVTIQMMWVKGCRSCSPWKGLGLFSFRECCELQKRTTCPLLSVCKSTGTQVNMLTLQHSALVDAEEEARGPSSSCSSFYFVSFHCSPVLSNFLYCSCLLFSLLSTFDPIMKISWHVSLLW